MNYQQAQDEIFQIFAKAISTENCEVFYPNIPQTRDKNNRVQIVVFIQHATGGQRTLGSPAIFQRQGFFTAQIYIPSGKGLQEGYRYASILSNVFEGKSSENGIWFRNARVNEVGEDGGLYQVNFAVEFTYDEIKEI